MERREAPGVCETPQGLVRPHRRTPRKTRPKVSNHPRQTLARGPPARCASPVTRNLPLETRSPNDVGASTSRRSTGRCRVFPDIGLKSGDPNAGS